MHNSQTTSGIKRQLRFRGDVSANNNRIEDLQNEETYKLPKVKLPTVPDDVGATATAAQQRLHTGKYEKYMNRGRIFTCLTYWPYSRLGDEHIL